MEIKESKVTFALVRRLQTTFKELEKYVGVIPQQLIAQAAKEGLKISGPQFWNYTGIDGNSDTKFQLEICVPVEEPEQLKSESTAYIDGFKHVAKTVKGSWSELSSAYENLIAEMAKDNLKPGKLCREIYHSVDFHNPENNITEIQLGIE